MTLSAAPAVGCEDFHPLDGARDARAVRRHARGARIALRLSGGRGRLVREVDADPRRVERLFGAGNAIETPSRGLQPFSSSSNKICRRSTVAARETVVTLGMRELSQRPGISRPDPELLVSASLCDVHAMAEDDLLSVEDRREQKADCGGGASLGRTEDECTRNSEYVRFERISLE